MKIKKHTKLVPQQILTNSSGNTLTSGIRQPKKIGQYILLTLCLLLFLLFSYLLFDVKPSLLGDDSNYIEMGYNLWHLGQYPAFQGPLYPIILSFFIGMFGINLVLLKLLSCVFLLAFIYLSFINFKKVVAIPLLLLIILFFSINPSFIYYASQTFSESLYMLFIALLIYFFNKFFITNNSNESNKKFILKHIVIALFILGCFLIRTAGIASLSAVLLYFISYRQWKNLIYIFFSFVGVFIVYSFCKKIAFPHADALQFTVQLKTLSQKNAYNITMGYEDAGGFVTRFWQNSKQYLGGHLLLILGLVSKEYTLNILEKGAIVTSFIYLVIGVSLWFSFKENKLLFFAGLLSITGMLLTFIMLQVMWNQDRLILVYMPYLLIIVAYFLYQFFNKRKTLSAGKWLSFIFLGFIIITSIKKTIGSVNNFSEERLAVADGNTLFGYTPDYQNYLEMSKWAAQHVGQDTLIGVRKPSIAFIYGQRPFFGIFNIPTISEEEAINYHPENGKTQYALSMQTMDNPDILNLFGAYRRYADVMVTWENLKVEPLADKQLGTALLSIPDSLTSRFENSAKLLKVDYDTSIKAAFDKMYKLNLKPRAYSFKALIDNLKNNKVHYMIVASLRYDPNQKTIAVITTLHKYIYILLFKYPGLTTNIKTIGTDEVSTLVKLEYAHFDY